MTEKSIPVSWQNAPRTLGEVSPTLACPKAPTKPLSTVSFPPPPVAQPSRNWAATPLLSPLMRELVLLMEVQCTGNQVTAPRPLQQRYPLHFTHMVA